MNQKIILVGVVNSYSFSLLMGLVFFFFFSNVVCPWFNSLDGVGSKILFGCREKNKTRLFQLNRLFEGRFSRRATSILWHFPWKNLSLYSISYLMAWLGLPWFGLSLQEKFTLMESHEAWHMICVSFYLSFISFCTQV